MESTNSIFYVAAGVFILFIAAYVVIMLLWPEWVGITGRVAKEAERSHREGAPATGDDFLTRAQKKPESGLTDQGAKNHNSPSRKTQDE